MMMLVYSLVGQNNSIRNEYNASTRDYSQIVEQVMEKIPPNNSKLTFKYKDININYLSDNGIVYLVISQDSVSRAVAFKYLLDLQQKFTSVEDSDVDFTDTIKDLLESYNTQPPEDQLGKTQNELNQVKDVMIQNMESIIDRGDRIDNLVDRTNEMSSQAFAFRKKSTMLRRQMWYKNKKIQLLTAFVGLSFKMSAVTLSNPSSSYYTSSTDYKPVKLSPLNLTNLPKLAPTEEGKRLAAYAAVDANISDSSKVIGIGSGSTVPYVVERIVQQGAALNEERVFIPTGFQSKELIVKNNLVLGDVDQYPTIDVTIDGADEVDNNLNAVKGGGACHLREKVLAEAAKIFVIVADERKNSKLLGTSWTQGVPIEVAPFAYAKVLKNVAKLGSTKPALRMGIKKAGPVVTDNGNFLIDAPFGESYYRDPKELLMRIKMLTGVVEVGLFCGMAKAAYFGYSNGSVLIRSADGTISEQSSI
ncbi:ribose-5-phosphate isomerase [Wallemia mellicola]|nr:ribose-5-phosphate isomerase [Wallemia mellicola]TIC10404.1 ribose-5-phosphate isomerase [Wallemia mellicola]